ncbi:MAG: strawberry notch C-terminal domain-containing protein [Luteolibacter sp.]
MDDMFRQAASGAARRGDSDEPVFAPRIANPIWRRNVGNRFFQRANKEAIAAENQRAAISAQEDREMRRYADRQREKAEKDAAAAAKRRNTWKVGAGVMIRKDELGNEEEFDANELVDDPEAGPMAQRSLYKGALAQAKRDVDERALKLRDPSDKRKLTDAQRVAILAEGDELPEESDRHKELKKQLMDDEARTADEQALHESRVAAKRLAGEGFSAWNARRLAEREKGPEVKDVAASHQAARQDYDRVAAELDAREKDLMEREAELAKPVRAGEAAALAPKQAELASEREKIKAERAGLEASRLKGKDATARQAREAADRMDGKKKEPTPRDIVAGFIGTGVQSQQLAGQDPGRLAKAKGFLNEAGVDVSAATAEALRAAGGDIDKAIAWSRLQSEKTSKSVGALGGSPAAATLSAKGGGKESRTYGESAEKLAEMKTALDAAGVKPEDRAALIQDTAKETAWTEKDADNVRTLSNGDVVINPGRVFGQRAELMKEIAALPVSDAQKLDAYRRLDAMREAMAEQVEMDTYFADGGFQDFVKKKVEEGVTDKAAMLDEWSRQQKDRNWLFKGKDAIHTGIASGSIGIGKTVVGSAAGVSALVGADDVAKSLAGTQQFMGDAQGSYRQAGERRGLTGGFGLTTDIFDTVTQMTPMFLGGYAAQGLKGISQVAVAGLSVQGWAAAQGYESKLSDALDFEKEKLGRDLTEEELVEVLQRPETQLSALANGAQTALLTKLMPGGAEAAALGKAGSTMTLRDFLSRGGGKLLKDQGFRNATLGVLKTTLKHGSDEALEEGLNQALDVLISGVGLDQDINLGDALEETLHAAALGGIVGGGMGHIHRSKPVSLDRVAAEMLSQDPDEAPPTQEELTRAQELVGIPASGDVATDAAEQVEGVRIAREIEANQVEALDELDAAEAELDAANQAGDPVAVQAAQTRMVKAEGRVSAGWQTSGALKIARGEPLTSLTSDEARSLGIVVKGDKFSSLSKTGLKDAGLSRPLVEAGADGSPILLDSVAKTVSTVAPTASGRIGMTETQARQAAVARAAQSQQTIQKSAVTAGNTMPQQAAVAADAGAVPTFRVTGRNGTVVEVSAANEAEAMRQGAVELPMGEQVTQVEALGAAVSAAAPAAEPMPTPAPAARGKAPVMSEVAVPDEIRKAAKNGAALTKNATKRLEQAIRVSNDPDVLARAEWDGRILVNHEAIAAQASAQGLDAKQTKEWARKIIDEEIRHLAQFDAAKALWEQAGKPDTFEQWRDAHYGAIWQNEFVAQGKDQIVADLRGSGLERLVPWQKAMEGLRMMSQVDASGKPTEAAKLWRNVGQDVIDHLKAVLKSLKNFVKDAKSNPTLKAELDALERELSKYEIKQPSRRSGQNRHQVPREIRETAGDGQSAEKERLGVATGEREAAETRRPEVLPSQSSGSDVGIGSRVSWERNGENLSGVVDAVAPGGALRVQLDTPDAKGLTTALTHESNVQVFQDAAVDTPSSPVAIAGERIDKDWVSFSKDSGTLEIPRSEMPQIKAEDRSAMVQFLRARGIDYQEKEVPPDHLKPTQAEFSPKKVDAAREYQGGDRALLVSNDGYLVDGHHQWLAKWFDYSTEPVRVIELNAPIRQILTALQDMPSVETAEQDKSTRLKSPEDKQEESTRAKSGNIGKNSHGNPISKDERGVRSYMERGIKRSQPVGFVPGRDGASIDFDSPEELFRKGYRDFLTAEEVEKFQGGELPPLTEQPSLSAGEQQLKDAFKGFVDGLDAAPLGDAVQTLLEMEPILADASVFQGVSDRSQLRKIGEREYAKLLDREPVNRRDGRKFEFTLKQFGKPKSHSADPRIMRLIPSLPELLENAVLLDSSPETDQYKYKNINGWHTYGVRAVLDGQPLFVQLSTFEQNGVEMVALYHDHNVLWEDAYYWGIKNGGSDSKGPTDSVTNQAVMMSALARNNLYRLMTSVNKGLDAASLGESYTQGVPAAQIGQFVSAAQTLIAEGVKTPEALGAALDKISPRLRTYSEAVWSAFRMVDPSLPVGVNWGEVYAKESTVSYARPENVSKKPENVSTSESTNKENAPFLKKGGSQFKGNDHSKTIAEATRDAALSGGKIDKKSLKNDALSAKEQDEAMELGLAMAAKKIAQSGQVGEHVFQRLVKLHEDAPSLTAKTSESKINQAYSTPAPLAWVASRLGEVVAGEVVYEPSAGHGMLLLETRPNQTIYANEFDPARIGRMRMREEGWNLHEGDAMAYEPHDTPDRVVANPPFGAVMQEDGSNQTFETAAGPTKSIDHAIMLRALEQMAPDGRATFLIGGPPKTAKSEEGRKAFYTRKQDFFKHLHENYGVVDHFTVSGELYQKQGAGWPVDVITIQGKEPSRIALPSAKVPRMISTWDDLFKTTQLTDEQRIQINRITEGEMREAVRDMVDDLGRIGKLGRTESTGEQSGENRGEAASGRQAVSSSPQSEGSENAENRASGGMDSRSDAGSQRESARVVERSGRERTGARDGSGGIAGRRGDTTGTQRNAVASGKFQAQYTPFSGAKGLDTLLPKNMVEPVSAAFERIKSDVGEDFTGFVRSKLGYPEETDIGKFLAGEQIDAVAAAIWNFERGGALIIGDQTGIGKGRIAAALMKYAVHQGFTPVFMTQKPSLHDAMLVDDLADIEADEVKPAVMDTRLQFDSAKNRKLEFGEAFFKQVTESGKLPEGSNAVFVTYDQIQADDAKGLSKAERARARNNHEAPPHSWRMEALKALAPNSVIILDESHLASGQSTRGWRVADILARSPRVYYSSATSVKRPENMGIYFKTNVGRMTGGDMTKVTELMNRGGVPAMQVVSSMLARDGQYLRRERSFDGVKFETSIAEENSTRDRQLADNLTHGLRQVVMVQDTMRQAADVVNKVIASAGKRLGVPASNRAKLETVNFSSKLHNIVSQYLLAIKTASAADRAIEEIRSGKKVVVSVQSTMESAIDALEEGGFPMTYQGLVLRYLDQMRFMTSGKKSWGKGEVETFEVTENGPPDLERLSNRELQDRMVNLSTDDKGDKVVAVDNRIAAEIMRRAMWDVYEQAREEIQKVDFGDLPLSPIDAMRQAVERAGIRTGEITGRARGIDENGEIYVRDKSEIGQQAAVNAKTGFNDENLDFLVINQSGSTGISLHASEKAKNQAKRVMIVAQPNLDINEFMQTLGRIHRSGQVSSPEFILLQTALPAEKRPAAILGRKMAMLNANTTSNAKTDVSEGNASVDIFNKYGDEVAFRILERDPDLQAQLRLLGGAMEKLFDGDKLVSLQEAEKTLAEQPDGYLSRSITGYLAVLPVEEQEIFWEKAVADYSAYIAYLDQIGKNDLEAKALDLKAKTIGKEEFTPQGEGDSAFDEPSFIETVETKAGKEPLAGEKAVETARSAKAKAGEAYQSYVTAANEAIRDAEASKAKRVLKWDEEKKTDFLAKQREARNLIAGAFQNIGKFGSVAREDGTTGMAVLESIKLDKSALLTPSKQIAILRVNDSRETMRVPVTKLAEAFTVSPDESAKEWDESRDVGGVRQIVTGNLIAAMEQVGNSGKVVTYTTDTGENRMGLLLPKNFTAKAQVDASRVAVKTADDLISRIAARQTVTSGDISFTAPGLLRVPASKAAGGKYWQNPKLNALAKNGHFIQVGSEMRAQMTEENLREAFYHLTGMGEHFTTPRTEGLDAAPLSDGQENAEAVDSPGNVFGTTYTPVPASELTSWQRDALRNAEAISGRGSLNLVRLEPENNPGKRGSESGIRYVQGLFQVFGKRVAFVKGKTQAFPLDGMVATSDLNTIIIDADAHQGVSYLMGHELGHSIQHQRPELYDALKKEILSLAKDWGDYDAYLAKRKEYDTLEKREVEFVNDFIGSQFGEPEFWRALHDRNKGVFGKLVDAALEYLAKIGGRIGKLHRDVRPYFDNVEAARTALVNTLESYQQGKFPDESQRKDLKDIPDSEYGLSAASLGDGEPTQKERIQALRERARKKTAVSPEAVKELKSQQDAFRGQGKVIGRPDLANISGDESVREFVDLQDEIRKLKMETESHAQWNAAARRKADQHPGDVEETILENAFTNYGRQLQPEDVIAAKIVMERKVREAGNDLAKHEEAAMLVQGYRHIRAIQARTLAAGYDAFKKPEERNREYLATAIYTLPRKTMDEIENRSLSPEQAKEETRKALRERLNKLERELKKMGVSFDEILGGQVFLSLSKTRLIQDALEKRNPAERMAISMIQKGNPLARIRKATGLPDEKIKGLYHSVRQELASKLRDKVKAGLRLEDLRDEGLSAAALNAATLTDEEIDAELDRILGSGFGLNEDFLSPNKSAMRRKKKVEIDPVKASWTRPEFTDGLNAYDFDTKDRSEIMRRVVALRDIAGAAGKVESLAGDKRAKADKLISEIEKILAKSNTSIREVISSGKAVEDYRFDISDRNHLMILARTIQGLDADWIDKAQEYAFASMLSGLQTMLVNGLGVTNTIWQATVDRGFETAVNAFFKDPESASLGEAKYILKATGPLFSRAWGNAMAAWGSETSFFEEDVLNRPPDLSRLAEGVTGYRTGVISGKKGRILRTATRILLATDDAMNTARACAEVGAMAYRVCRVEGLKPGTTEFDREMKIQVNTPGSIAWQLAARKAVDGTFNAALPGQKDVTGKMVRSRVPSDLVGSGIHGLSQIFTLKEGDSMAVKAFRALAKVLFFPFVRVPYNILKQGVERTLNPVSMLDIAALIGGNLRIRDGKWTLNANGGKQELIERLGKQLQGASLMLLLAASGAGEGDDDDLEKPILITGSRPIGETKKGERQLGYRAGVSAFQISIKLPGNKRLSAGYGRIEPFATQLGATIDMMRSFKMVSKGRATFGEAGGKVLSGLVAQANDKTTLRGMSDMIALASGDRPLDRYAADRIGIIVPNMLKQAVRETDPVFREKGQSFSEMLAQSLFPYGQQEAARDLYGNEKTKAGNALTRIFDPTDTGIKEMSVADQVIFNWNRQNPSDTKAPQEPNYNYKDPVTGKNQRMTPGQHAKFSEIAGKRAEVLLKRQHFNIKNPTEYDMKRLEAALTEARTFSRAMLFKNPKWKTL